MQATARVLEINCQMVYIPGVMLVSFGDPTTHTSETKVRHLTARRSSLSDFTDASPLTVFEAGERPRPWQAAVDAHGLLERESPSSMAAQAVSN